MRIGLVTLVVGDYDAAIGFYQKSLNLLRLAAKPPGRV